ncbi:hypothetical protein [Rhodococcus erythropolis]|uniref:hypothetical protein n=1 Tax=Rhodococcus erythropolis TaxID=1833 RepID=UPI00301414EA
MTHTNFAPGRNITDRLLDEYPTQHRHIAVQYVGHRIQVSRQDRWNCDRRASITMVIPSRNGLCWLIEYSNGSTDVIRIFGNPEQFEITP